MAISSTADPVWPMKKWAYYDELKNELESAGLRMNILQSQPTLLKHLADVQGHRCLVSGDSLPMHVALGCDVRCVSIFTCTSPWEIYGYGLQKKLSLFFWKGFSISARLLSKRGHRNHITIGHILCELVENELSEK